MSKRKIIFVVCIALLILGTVALAGAYVRPANPTMDYVPQNLGIYDTYYKNFYESDCRTCHGASTADRHHMNERALMGDCCFCHKATGDCANPVPPVRDCKVCHIDGGPVGDFGFPHHRSDSADSDNCTACHDPNLLSQTNTVDPPAYPPSLVAPTPFACENCHWPSGALAPHQAPPQADWMVWQSFPSHILPSWWPDGLANPQPLEANGPVFSGVLEPTKAYRPQDGTHHEIAGKVYPKCYICHANGPDQDPSWDPANPYLIRYCENCHDVGTLHAIPEHVTTGGGASWTIDWEGNTLTLEGGYAVDGSTGQVVVQNAKCYACHGDNLPPGMPDVPGAVPVLQCLEPNFGPSGITVTIVPQVGSSFGTKLDADGVEVGQGVPPVYVDVPVASWSEDRITVKIPGWTYVAGNAKVRVRKTVNLGAGNVVKNSNTLTFKVRDHNKITSVAPAFANWGNQLTITGTGFFAMRAHLNAPDCRGQRYGYESYVEINASNDRYRFKTYDSWAVNQIKVTLGLDPVTHTSTTLIDTKNGNPVPDPSLYLGPWNVTVVTDYYMDDGSGNHMVAGVIDTNDQIVMRDISDPVAFTVTKTPYIAYSTPNPVPSTNTFVVSGANFGQKGAELMGDGKGNENGICDPKEICKGVRIWNAKHTIAGAWLKVMNWSNTAITVKAPKNATCGTTNIPKKKAIQVTDSKGTTSNFYNITISCP